MTFSEIVIIAIAGFCSGVIKTGVGVGAGVFLLPTLALAFPAKIALGLGAPMMLVSDIIGLRYYWKEWLPRPELTRFFIGIVPGLLLGIYLLPLIPGDVFRICVGVFGGCYALSLLWQKFPLALLLKKIFDSAFVQNKVVKKSFAVYIYSFLGALSTVLAHAGGLVWSLYLLTAAQDRRVFVGTTIILFFITNIYKTFSYIYIDILSLDALWSILTAVPMIFLGSCLGNRLNKKCNYQLFRKIVLCFIFIVSISLCI